jgi:hypothetical protein
VLVEQRLPAAGVGRRPRSLLPGRTSGQHDGNRRRNDDGRERGHAEILLLIAYWLLAIGLAIGYWLLALGILSYCLIELLKY